MTIASTISRIRDLGMTATFKDSEYRVTYPLSYLASLQPAASRSQLIALAERLAYFTNDSEDAIATAVQMERSY